ncbi:MAG: hypothetical protein RTU30_02955 [Candidatus Thorarchaeota archaeon]
MIQSIYIVSDAGETLAAITLSDFKLDEVMFGGFLSAIQMFSQQMSGKAVKEMSMESYRLIIADAKKGFVVTVHERDDSNAVDINKKILAVVDDNIQAIITDDILDLVKEAAAKTPVTGRADKLLKTAA